MPPVGKRRACRQIENKRAGIESITTLVFDFGGVIFPIEPFSAGEVTKQERINIRRIIYGLAADLQKNIEDYKLSTEQFKNEFTKRAKNLSPDRIAIIIKSICEPNQRILKIIDRFSKSYKIYGLVNASFGWTELRESIHRLDEYFLRVFTSNEIGIRKPDFRIFHYFLQQTGSKASECIFIDNDAENIAMANSLGFHAHLYKNPDELENFLKKI